MNAMKKSSIQGSAELFSGYYMNAFNGFEEKYGKELYDIVRTAYEDGFNAGAQNVIHRITYEIGNWTKIQGVD